MADEPRRRNRYGCEIAFALTIIVILAVVIFPAVRAARIAAQRTQRANCMTQIGLALHNFHDTYRRFPLAIHRDETGRPLYSWRLRVLMYVEAIMRDWDHAARWDDPGNEWLTSQPHLVYCFRTNRPLPERLHTNVVAITGPGTVFDGDRECRLADIDSDTILAMEIAESGTHWAAPGDLSVDEVTPSILEGLDGLGVLVLLANGEVWFVPAEVPFEDFRKFLTIEGAKGYDWEHVFGAAGQRMWPS